MRVRRTRKASGAKSFGDAKPQPDRQCYREPGLHVLAEDLGVIPDFVRTALTELHVPGYKVMRWERAYHAPGQPFIDPATYPEESVAASGTHDTETVAAWFDRWWPTVTDALDPARIHPVLIFAMMEVVLIASAWAAWLLKQQYRVRAGDVLEE